MSDRHLDRRCAEILGWSVIKDAALGRLHGVRDGKGGIIPKYSTSLDACRELLEWVESSGKQRGRFHIFCLCLANNLGFKVDMPLEYLPQILLATPLQICEAFVECFGEPK